MYSNEHFCDCVDDSVCGAGILMVVVLLLKMMNRVFQFRTMEPTNIFICRSDTLMLIPQWVSHFQTIYICPCIMIRTLEMEYFLVYM